jgi:NADPH-dependent ferric siderophore reductase
MNLQTGPSAPQAFARPQRPVLTTWRLTVAGASDLTPNIRRVDLLAEAPMPWRPGQDLKLEIPQGEGGGEGDAALRHYSIRRLNLPGAELSIDVVRHGQGGPAECWAEQVRPGDRLLAHGPRGRTRLAPDADWHLFVGDETALPAIFAMLEHLPRRARALAVIEVGHPDDRQYLDADCDLDLEWLVRKAPAGAASLGLIERIALFAPPPSRGHAYVLGETATVRIIRHGLLARGLAKDQITAEGYWRPGRVGGHDHIRDEPA